jgi:hypothetical protein
MNPEIFAHLLEEKQPFLSPSSETTAEQINKSPNNHLNTDNPQYSDLPKR